MIGVMAFGQQGGPPATARQLKEMMALLEQAGYSSFREARGPLGFTQRQGGGKFTGPEAAAFIEQLESESEAEAEAGSGSEAEPAAGPKSKPRAKAKPVRAPVVAPVAGALAAERREARLTVVARDLPPHILARELERRGWILIPPEGFAPSDG